MQGKVRCLLVVALFLAAPGLSSPSHASDYVMRAVVKPGDVIDGVEIARVIAFAMAINDSGEVAFLADFHRAGGGIGRGIFTQRRAIARVGETIDGLELVGFTPGPGSINERGDIAFFGVFLDGVNTGGIFFAPGPASPPGRKLLARQGTAVAEGELTTVGWPAIDDAANVVFSGVVDNRYGLFATSPAAPGATRIVGPGDVIGGATIDGLSGMDAKLTGSGDLRFDTILRDSPAIRSALFSRTALLRQGGDVIDGRRLASFFEDAVVDDGGEVAFRAPFTDTQTGTPGTGWFTAQKAMAATGDVVDGETIAALAGQPGSLLDDGRFFFAARLSSGTQRALLSLDEVLVRPGDPVELAPGESEPLVAVQNVAANNQGRVFILGFVDSLQEVLIEVLPADADGDGVPDTEDQCLASDTGGTVVIDGCDSAAPNLLGETGCSISDGIARCAGTAGTHGQFQSCVGDLTNELKKAGLLTGDERAAIQACAGHAAVP
jgi:hypothetical protein